MAENETAPDDVTSGSGAVDDGSDSDADDFVDATPGLGGVGSGDPGGLDRHLLASRETGRTMQPRPGFRHVQEMRPHRAARRE